MSNQQTPATRAVRKQGKRYHAIAFTYLCFLCAGALLFSGNAWAEKVTLNFKDADIKAVITSVADITGKNFIVDPRVKGKATIISKRPMNKGEVYKVFLSVLEVHGYTAVPSGRVTKIVPDADAKHSGMPTVTDAKPGIGDEAVTQVIQIEHVTAAQLVPILRPLVPPQGHLAAYPQSNVLIVSDRARNIERLISIIKRVDQPSSGEIEIVALEHAAAADLVRVLNNLQQQQGGKGAKTDRPTLVADERTNSILIGGDRSDRLALRAIISHLDTPSEVTGDTHVIYLRYAKAKDLVSVLTGVAESKKKAGVKGQAAKAVRGPAAANSAVLNIQADEASNALVITASPTVFKSLESVVRQLDVRRAQVLVEAIIAEVANSKAAELGVQWLFDGSNQDQAVGTIDFTGFASKAAQAAGTASASGNANAAALASVLGQGANLAFGRFNSNKFNFAGLLKALQSDGNTNVLSTPSLVTLDNEDAEIFIGEEVSIPTGTFSSTGSSSTPTNPFTTFERKPVGISLQVKPQINEGDAIQLEIEQKVDSLSSGIGSAGTGGLVTAERRIKTNVIVDNGSILVLGGLVKDDLIESHSKVPLLGDIPILGFLFRYENVTKVKTNLMVFLRPTIMRDAKQSLALTNSKYTNLKEVQEMFNQDATQLWLEGDPPQLPEMDSLLTLPPPFEETQKQQPNKTLFNEPETEPDALDF